MPIVEWSPSFAVGIEEFDQHHRHLFTLLNRTFDIFSQGMPKEILNPVLEELSRYAASHFAAEEQWMMERGYPDLQEHRREHAVFTERVAQFREEYPHKSDALALEVLQFLQGWLVDHILKSDADYGQRHQAGDGPA